MRSKKSTQVIIIGAGGSKPYNFPTGEELFTNVQKSYLEMSRKYASKVLGTTNPNNNIIVIESKKFIQNLNGITGISLDKYINLNQSEKDNGVHAIAIEILRSEQHSYRPGTEEIKGDWYKYLFSKMISGLDSYSEIRDQFHSNLVFITFNYDRSLENYLFTNLFNILKPSGHTKEDVASIINSIPIIHVYGKTGYLEWEKEKEEDKIFQYGYVDEHLFENSKIIIPMIQLIYDERKNNTIIQKAKNYIEMAQRVLFCGFGFDELNLRILGFPSILGFQEVFGTAYEMKPNEIQHYRSLISGDSGSVLNRVNLKDCDSLTLLREHLLV